MPLITQVCLQEDGTNSDVRSIRLDTKRFAGIWCLEYWSSRQLVFDKVETRLAGVVPSE